MIKLAENDILNLAFVYNYMEYNSTILKEDVVKKYIKEFYYTLKKLKIAYEIDYMSENEYVYDYLKDKDGEGYYILKYKNMEDILYHTQYGIYASDLIKVAESENVLNILGIVKQKDDNYQKIYGK